MRAWSRPLLPDEQADLPGLDGPPLTLRQLLRTQVDRSGPSLMVEALVARGEPREVAERQATAAFNEIGPAVRYVIDDAPLYAVRPLMLLDVAELSAGPHAGRL